MAKPRTLTFLYWSTDLNILIVTEKPSLSKIIAPACRAHWPAANITFVHAVPYGNFRFRYPRGLKLQDYPLVCEPVYQLNKWDTWFCPPFVMGADGSLSKTAMSEELFTQADEIVFACDPDYGGAVAFDVLMAAVFGDNRALACPALIIIGVDQASIERAFAQIPAFGPSCRERLEYGRVKYYFDWNWNVNALVILGEAQRAAGVPANAPPLSKYALQLLYALRNEQPLNEPLKDGPLVHRMANWPGTGRYRHLQGHWHNRLGSVASRQEIINNLVAAGLLDRTFLEMTRPLREFESPPSTLALSERGHALLARLHPDCEDPDLPFRLGAWCEKGVESKPAINRYIKTFFGKQKRFNAREA